ncbi:MAG: hypothetical protein LBI43_05165 [Streptococcaceae bacterium]|nr:hypothetical protein [Streptococcaceae bacterium]
MITFREKDVRIFEELCWLAKDASHFSDVTIEKIAGRMNLSRQAIYKNYYRSIDDILESMHIFVDQEGQSKIKEFLRSKNSGFIHFLADEILPIIYEKRQFQATLYRYDPTWLSYIEKAYLPIFSRYLKETIKVTFDSDFAARLVIQQILTILSQWVQKEQPETPLDFHDKFIYLLSVSPTELMNEKFL